MKKFEYYFIKLDTEAKMDWIQEMGSVGWELISFVVWGTFPVYIYYFKREITA